jgi:hypothetical protein
MSTFFSLGMYTLDVDILTVGNWDVDKRTQYEYVGMYILKETFFRTLSSGEFAN